MICFRDLVTDRAATITGTFKRFRFLIYDRISVSGSFFICQAAGHSGLPHQVTYRSGNRSETATISKTQLTPFVFRIFFQKSLILRRRHHGLLRRKWNGKRCSSPRLPASLFCLFLPSVTGRYPCKIPAGFLQPPASCRHADFCPVPVIAHKRLFHPRLCPSGKLPGQLPEGRYAVLLRRLYSAHRLPGALPGALFRRNSCRQYLFL